MTDLVVVADDDVDIANLIAFTLRSDGLEVAVVLEGEAAIDLCKEEDVDLLVLDLMMPGTDGMEVCRQLRLDPRTKDLPVLMMTAASSLPLSPGLESGVTDWVRKPFDPQVVSDRVGELLSQRSARRPRG